VTRSPGVGLDWARLLDGATRGEGLESCYQPIVDLARGVVVGYEALARFTGPGPSGPDQWFTAARAAGCLAPLEAAALRAALRHRADLPVNTFLAVNVGPDVLTEPEVRAALEDAGSLEGVVIELTEHAPVPSWELLAKHLDRLRGRGALIAMDDAGSGHAGLTMMLQLRPDLIKLDRELVTDVHRNEAKRVLVEMVGTLADRLDAWLLAEGIESWAETAALARLGVPLGQGYFLARPAPPWTGIDPDLALRLMSLVRERDAWSTPPPRGSASRTSWSPTARWWSWTSTTGRSSCTRTPAP
jgi:EAL domain-containing protein (putative c-di-GMP-specific phosphodiesterase class I)